ncbi:MAG: ExeM/NucH family extracellular endonuclease [Cyanobacteria bacterium J06642_2]
MTQLSPGDLAIIGVNADNDSNGNDSFNFVLLTDIEAGTEIFFTDNSVLSDGSFRTSEGILKYTAASNVAAGTVVSFTGIGGEFTSESGSFALSVSGDQVIAYQGTAAAPTFIYAAQTNSTEFQTGSDDSNQSDLPPGLTVGSTAVAVGSGPGAEDEFDNSTYNESLSSGTQAELLTAISDASNWNGSNELITDLADGPFVVTDGGGSATVLEETFDDASQFATSTAFFSDAGVSSGFDFFGISDGAGGGDFGGDPQPNGIKAYTGLTGSFLTGQDLDGEGATLPITVTWSNLDISGLSNLEFSGDFAEFFDAPGDIDAADFIRVSHQIDGGGFQNLLWFSGADFSSTSGPFNGILREDTDFDGVGDGAALGDAAQTFAAAIAGTGSTLDLQLSVSLDAGDEDFAVDNFRIAEASTSGSSLSIAPTDAVKDEGNSGTKTFSFTVMRSGDTSGTASVDFAVTSSAADANDFDSDVLPSGTVDFADGETSQVIDILVAGDMDAEPDEDFTVTLSNPSGDLTISTVTASGTIQNDDGIAITPISAVQGSGTASPLLGQQVTIEAVVVGDFQDGASGTDGDLNGFFVQEEDADFDNDSSTSEGIFVFDGSSPAVDVAIGDLVRISGTVDEFFGETQIDTVTNIEIVSSDNSNLVSPATITFPVASTTTNSDGEFIADLEAFEGMLVTIPQELTVSDLFTLGRFGDIGLHADGRLETFTQANAPSVSGFQAFQDQAVRNTVILDDGSTIQNPTEIPFDVASAPGDVPGQLDANDELRSGDSLSDLTGVVRFGRGSGGSGDANYRINPTVEPGFVNDNTRPTQAPDVGGDITVASFNVLNFFTSLDDGSTPGSGPNNLDPRGADNQEEFDRQVDKLVAALSETRADVFGLIELENEFGGDQNGDGQFAIDFLVNELNSAIPGANYQFVDPSQAFIDTGDAISVGLIYNADTMQIAPGTTVEILTDSDLAGLGMDPGNPVFDGPGTSRAPLAVTFEEIATGEDFTVAVNHFKSKGSISPFGNNAGVGDGAGNNNEARLQASIALDAWLDTDPTGSGDDDFLIVGDLNAYGMEDPIQFLLNEGYEDQIKQFLPSGEFEYSFGFPIDLGTSPQVQAFGALDYALANSSLASQVTGAAEWHINADEASAFDYNTEFKPQEQIDGLFAANPFRASDHDPLIVGLDLSSPVQSEPVFSFSPDRDSNVGAAEDIVQFNDDDSFSVLFDGSDLGLGGANIDAFDIISDTEILLSFNKPVTLAGLGRVDDSDIVRFNADSLGEGSTAGTFTLELDGSDLELTKGSEDIDALTRMPDGSLVFSTNGNASFSNDLKVKDEDLVHIDSVTGELTLFFDGSDVQLKKNSEDVNAVGMNNGDLLLSTTGNFNVPGLSGKDEDVASFIPSSTGENTSGIFGSELFFDGSQSGFTGDISAFDFGIG